MVFLLAFRNLARRLRRYAFMGAAIALAFALISTVTGAANGALEAVKDKAARYFSGHISITGFHPGLAQRIDDPDSLIQDLWDTGLPLRTVSRRTMYNNNDGVLFYSGQTVRQRRLVGVDFAQEGKEFDGLRFLDGGWREMETGAEPGILISRAAAKLLGCRSGDGITLYLTTDSGQYNTANLIVRGVFDETSLFGYIAYMRNSDLNRLLLRGENAATDLAVYVRSGQDVDQTAADLAAALETKYTLGPLFASREERDAALGALVQEPTLVVLTQGAQLAQIRQLLDALLLITYGVLAVFLTIVMAGILNTYRVLVHERRKEIGVMRALGMQRGSVRRLFITEAALLAALSSLLGLVVALGLLKGISMLNLSFIPGSGLFLEGGRLRMSLSLSMTAANGGLMLLAAVLAASGPARKAGRIRPADAMRSA